MNYHIIGMTCIFESLVYFNLSNVFLLSSYKDYKIFEFSMFPITYLTSIGDSNNQLTKQEQVIFLKCQIRLWKWLMVMSFVLVVAFNGILNIDLLLIMKNPFFPR